jgi:hypothetical protein
MTNREELTSYPDFSPIRLVHGVAKIVTKMLSLQLFFRKWTLYYLRNRPGLCITNLLSLQLGALMNDLVMCKAPS